MSEQTVWHLLRVARCGLWIVAAAWIVSPIAHAQSANRLDATSLTGYFNVIWGDPAPESIALIPLHEYVITDHEGRSTRLDIDEGALRGAGGITALNGTVVTVTGQFPGSIAGRAVSSGSEAVFSVESILLSESGPGIDQDQVAPVVARAVSGSQSWISILCRFSDVVDEPKTLSYFQNMYVSTSPGLDHYWREVSYDTVNVLGSGAVEDCTGVADDDVYFPNYVGINLMFNDDLDGYAWGALNI